MLRHLIQALASISVRGFGRLNRSAARLELPSIVKMPTKRKHTVPSGSEPPSKKPTLATNGGDDTQFDHSRASEKYGIVLRDFYPPEMSNERCAMYNRNELPRPIAQLETGMAGTKQQRDGIEPGNAVIHWFKRDLRLYDNKPLSLASGLAKRHNIPLICLFVISPQDYEAHGTSKPRVDFELRTLEVMKEDLSRLDIPLIVETIEDRKTVPTHIVDLCKQHDAKHIFCGMEYEVDELRRERKLLKLCLDAGISFNVLHDDVVVPPGALQSGQGKQYSVYSPWYRAWVAHLHKTPSLLACSDELNPNPPTARERFAKLFDAPIPDAPPNKSLSPEERAKFASLWPAGEHEALDRLHKFLQEKVSAYKDMRSIPSANSSSLLSVHLSTGTLSARTAVRTARDANTAQKLDGGKPGIISWISEVAWRDFYKHVLAHWPYVCMNKSFKYEYGDIEWGYDMDLFHKWCRGMTGYPIVDAGMRQLLQMGYMHNRPRMICASFLAKHLLTDWRLGERHFMTHLIDGDFASNNGGWGFSASTGVDPQPYFRIFNPLLQSEKFDADGDFIRKWVPELKSLDAKAIHDPYGRGAGKVAEKEGYPRAIVEHRFARERALSRYKEGLKRETAS